jgi:histidinol-phosphate phosphatase family protein
MQALILAAGVGSRLRPITDSVPKAMVPIDNGLPLLEHVIRHLHGQGVSEFVVNLHHKPEAITSHFGDGTRLGVRIQYSFETNGLLDTAGAIRHAAPLLGGEFLLVYADQVHFFDFAPLVELRRKTGAVAALALKCSDDPSNGDLAELDDRSGRILKWHPRPHGITEFSDGIWLNTGLYALSKNIVDDIPAGRPVSLDREIIPGVIDAGVPVFGLPADEEILDIGTPEKYALARKWFSAHPARKRRALFLDRDGVILKALPRGEYLTEWNQAVLLEGVLPLLRSAHEAGYVNVVVTNQPQVSRGLIHESELDDIHATMTEAVQKRLDAIYYCPHTDADCCDCRKPKAGMLMRAAEELNLALDRSIMVGDSDRDVIAGRLAECRTVFVRNQHNADEIHRCTPDAVINHLQEIMSLL